MQGGEGTHSSIHDGTDGGSVSVIGGKSNGLGIFDDGGSINITAGASRRGDGGSIGILSGSSHSKSSKFPEESQCSLLQPHQPYFKLTFFSYQAAA